MKRNYTLRLQYEGVYGELKYYEQVPDSLEKQARVAELKAQEAQLLKLIKETNSDLITEPVN